MSQLLAEDGLFVASAINSTQAAAWCQESIDNQDEQAAAAAILSGRDGMTTVIPGLIALLDDDNLAAQAAAWALGQLKASDELAEKALLGSLDERENAYGGLCVFIGKYPDLATEQSLIDTLHKALENELQRAQSGRTGLCEHACRALATIGAPNCVEAIQRVIDTDPLTDRFELQRLRKELDDYTFDNETRERATANWDSYFADELSGEIAAEQTEEPEIIEELTNIEEASPEDYPNLKQEAELDSPVSDHAADSDLPEDMNDDASEETSEPPLDIDGYAAQFEDPESPDLRLIQQVVPMLSQLSEQAVKMPLQVLAAQEFAILILQVLPQALPPQYLQALLTPDALNAMSRFFRWHEAQGNSGELLAGLGIVREQLQEQVRASGMLGGPDFSDPDEATPAAE